MKTIVIMGAMSVALLTVVSCSETETAFNSGPEGEGPTVALGISADMQGTTSRATRAVVDGTKLTYATYDDDHAPGIAVLLTNKEATAWYNGDLSQYGGHNVWFMGDGEGNGWTSITERGTSFGDATKVPYNLSTEVGKVFAYYPRLAEGTGTGQWTPPATFADSTQLLVPVSVMANGTIDATANNAKKTWNTGTSTWDDNIAAAKLTNADQTEKDFLYFKPDWTSGGRYVNNGRAAGFPVVTGAGNNGDANNPGFSINLPMEHALSKVTIRVYDGGNLEGTTVAFTKFEIKNLSGDALKNANGTMALVDGQVAPEATAGSIVRNVTGYNLMRQKPVGTVLDGTDFIEEGGITGALVSKAVSAIVYPTTVAANTIGLVITLQADASAAVDYPVTLPAVAQGWEAGKNYIYTLSAGRNKLNVMNVTVTDWSDMEQGELPL